MLRRRVLEKVGEEKRGDLQVTPMIDVVFLLLVFFLLASRFRAPEGDLRSYLPLDRGQEEGEAPPISLVEPRVKLLWLDEDGEEVEDPGRGHVVLKVGEQVFPNRTLWDPVTERREPFPDWDGLEQWLNDFRALQERTDRGRRNRLPVTVDARRKVPWKHVIAAVNTCKRAGFEQIEFAVTERPLDGPWPGE